MSKRFVTIGLTALLVLVVVPGVAKGITLGFGLGGGGTFPLSRYVKAAPVSNTYSLKDVKNGPGWSLHAELLLIGMEIRYTWQVFTWKSITYTDSNGNIQSASTSGLPWLQFHSLTLGYRWYIVNSKFKLYLPLGGGATFVTFNDVDKLKGQYGFTLYAGLALEYEIVSHISIGLGARYNFFLTNQPQDIVEGKIKKSVNDSIQKSITSGSVQSPTLKVKDMVALFHSITANLSFTVFF